MIVMLILKVKALYSFCLILSVIGKFSYIFGFRCSFCFIFLLRFWHEGPLNLFFPSPFFFLYYLG